MIDIVADYHADPSGKSDSATAIQAALDANPGRHLAVPPGRYRCAKTLTIRHTLELAGEQPGGWRSSSILAFDPGVAGVVVDFDPGDDGGSWSSLANLAILGSGTGNDGLTLHARAWVRGCWIRGFGGHGLVIEGNVPGSNASLSRVDWSTIDQCGGDGVHIAGDDASVVTLVGVSSSENRGCGFLDRSFFGGSMLGCHAEGNAKEPYSVQGGMNRSVLVGCYAEGGPVPSRLGDMVWVFGGVHDSGIVGGQVMVAGAAHARFQADHPDAAPLTAMGRPGMSFPAFLVRDRNTTPVAGVSEGGTYGSWFAPGWNRPGDQTRLDLWVAPTDTSLLRIGAIGRDGYTGPIGAWTVGADGDRDGQGWHALTTIGDDGRHHEAARFQAAGVAIGKGGLRLAPTSAAERADVGRPGTIVGDEAGLPIVRTVHGTWVALGGS